MKRIHYLLLFVGLLALNSFGARATIIRQDSIIQTITYDPHLLSITNRVVDYGDIVVKRTNNNATVPVDNIIISVPYNATNFRIEFKENIYYYILEETRLDSIYQHNELVEITLYQSDELEGMYSLLVFEPTNPCSINTYGFVYGDNKIVKLDFLPVSYNSTAQVYKFVAEGTIKLKYDIDDSIVPPVIRYNLDTKVADLATIKPSVINGSSMMGYSYICNNPIINNDTSQYSLPTYEYCVITNHELEPAFKKIIAMKRQKGLSAGIICMEELMNSPICNEGDYQGNSITTITDSAGVVRQYLKYAFQSQTTPTRYVLMGGKAPYAPIRYVHSSEGTNMENSHVSTDMYFSNLSLKWVHKSSSFDEQNESEYKISNYVNTVKTPFFLDIVTGRLLCSTKEDVDNYSDKLHKYIFNPGDGNGTYLNNITFADAGNLFDDKKIRDFTERTVEDNYNANFYYLDNALEHLNGSQFISFLNTHKQNFVSINAHGDTQSIKILASSNNNLSAVLTALDSCPVESWIQDEDGNGLDCLTNKNEPFVLYTLACSTMPYDKALNIEGSTTTHGKYNFGESFTLGKKYGGPAYLGNTRESFSSSTTLEFDFLKSLFSKKAYSLGLSEAFSKLFFYDSSKYSHTILTHNLLGDPEFEMWTSEPQRYEGLSISRYSVSSYVQGVTQSDTISYCDNDGNVGRIYGEDGLAVLVGISHNSSIMVYNHNHIPYIFPLLLQNCDINNSQYVYASAFSAGSDVSTTVESGNVTIKSGATYEVEATDDVHLGEGFIVENGATFAIKTPGEVTIDGCVFLGGANVKIEARKVKIMKSFTAELGSKVEITQCVE